MRSGKLLVFSVSELGVFIFKKRGGELVKFYFLLENS